MSCQGPVSKLICGLAASIAWSGVRSDLSGPVASGAASDPGWAIPARLEEFNHAVFDQVKREWAAPSMVGPVVQLGGSRYHGSCQCADALHVSGPAQAKRVAGQ